MTQEIKQSAITIDGNNYALDDLSAHAQAQIIIGDRPRFSGQGNRGQTTVYWPIP